LHKCGFPDNANRGGKGSLKKEMNPAKDVAVLRGKRSFYLRSVKFRIRGGGGGGGKKFLGRRGVVYVWQSKAPSKMDRKIADLKKSGQLPSFQRKREVHRGKKKSWQQRLAWWSTKTHVWEGGGGGGVGGKKRGHKDAQ